MHVNIVCVCCGGGGGGGGIAEGNLKTTTNCWPKKDGVSQNLAYILMAFNKSQEDTES